MVTSVENSGSESTPGSELWAIVVAGGSGTRFGRAKQLESLAGQRMVDRSIRAVSNVAAGVIAVGDPALGTAEELAVDHRVDGGPTRSASVRAGLAALPATATHVLVHDAARPLASDELVRRVAARLEQGARAVVPVVPVTDSLRERDDGVDGRSTAVDRDRLVSVQTPQGFDVSLLKQVHGQGDDASDDASLVERSGVVVEQVDGDPRNIKVTFPHDLKVAEVLLDNSQQPSAEMRVGQGFDVHPFGDDPSKPLVLGGVAFPEMCGLQGHSDADVIAHACTDAILGAAGLGDIGQVYPDTDPRWAGADSIELLSKAAGQIEEQGWRVVNIDCTVIVDQPKIAPHRQSMEENLSRACGGPVTVKGKRTEGIPGLGGGIQCQAMALLSSHQGQVVPERRKLSS
jgi:2-C-methyl-D-erythritol 2,4-cyclodiphosphate synthase/2-C-methyl-D-erythritol 4-phosphate cytidylyltransferase